MESYTISWWAYLNTTWTNISTYVESNRFDVNSKRGMQTNNVGDNLAGVGTLTLTVINTDGRFDPDSASPLSGWGKGTIIEMRVLYTERTFKRARGHIDSIVPNDISKADKTCTVTLLDFMDYIYNMPLTAPLIQTNKTGDVAVNALIAALPIQPQATSIQTGSYTYPAIFDTATTKTKMSTELEKIVNSEGSYFYIRCDPTYGETLVWENALIRNGLVTARQLPETLADSKFLQDHDIKYLVDHLGRRLKANEACNCVLGDNINSQDRSNGDVINKATITAYPKKPDTSNQVLFRLDSPMLLGSGETKTFKGRYTNPAVTTSTQVNAVQSSMSVTTKTMNTLIDGTGTDLSANLIATAVFYSSYPEWTVYNSSSYAGYITVLTASGLGIYQDNPIEFSVEDALSQAGNATQNGYGVKEYTIDQQYQRDIAPGTQLISGILEENKQPFTKWNSVSFIASTDELMIAFLNVDIGDMIQITNSDLNTDSYFFIQGIEFTISKGDSITFTWILKKYDNLNLGLSPMAIQFNGTNADYVDFGYLPQASNLNDKTLSAWVYLTAYVFGWAIGNMGIFGGCGLGFSTVNPATGLSENNFFTYVRATGWTTTSGQWKATTTFNTNTWVHILATVHPKDNTANPVLYINGVSSSVTETEAPTGAYIGTEWNTRLGMEALYLSPTGKIKDARVYNRILTPTEALAITNEGAYGTGVLSGLVFQAPTVRTRNLTYFTDKTLASSDKIIDNIYGAIGTPNGSPITRLP
jgi:hypothetical protein